MEQGVVLDSYALLAFWAGEPGADRVASLLQEAADDAPVLMSYANVGEVLYILERRRGSSAPYRALSALSLLPVTLVEVGRRQTIAAARLKARYLISYADGICAALGKLTGLPVVTGAPEYHSLEGEIEVIWLS